MDTIFSRLYNLALAYAVRSVKNNEDGIKMESKISTLGYADGLRLVGKNKMNLNRNRKTLAKSEKEPSPGLKI